MGDCYYETIAFVANNCRFNWNGSEKIMASLNKVTLIGRLGKDPEVRRTQTGDAITNLSIATSEKYKDKKTGQYVENTEWHRVTAFGALAEIMEKYLHKGQEVYIEGSIHTRKWTDASGVEKYSTDIKANSMLMLGDKKDAPPKAEPKHEPKPSNEIIDDDVPF
jgi:single-strand DNA-binding protein